MNIRIVQRTLSIFAISMLATHGAAQSSSQIPDSNRVRAVALWEEVIKAKGGRERLHSIQNILIVSKVNVEAPQKLGPSETRKLYVLPDRALLQASSPQLNVVLEAIVFSIERQLCTVKISPGQAAAGPSPCSLTAWRPHLIHDPVIYLLETKWLHPRLLGTRVEGRGNNQFDVIEAEINELRVDLYLDRKTRLPFKLVTNVSDGTRQLSARGAVTIMLRDYTSVDGIQMPRSITRESAPRSTMVSRDLEDARYSFNVPYDKSLFEAR
jgi:hypothetical protein